MGYSPRGRKESDATERLHFHFQHKIKVKKKNVYQEKTGIFWSAVGIQ